MLLASLSWHAVFVFWCNYVFSWLWFIMTFPLEHGICCIFPSQLFCPLSDGYSVSKKMVFYLLLTLFACFIKNPTLRVPLFLIEEKLSSFLGMTWAELFPGKHQPLYNHVTQIDSRHLVNLKKITNSKTEVILWQQRYAQKCSNWSRFQL